ncbi:hypothetical protein GGX14DRAFT_522019 [Mycena pura]|uniref:Transmembrane protein n=1 Tax=Mycena pura TaxID=153505 RepID=A0AAD6VH61_9AGAR|nr:hypothetical protein GGX14DRAFT_522019 [Mycena pura]
MTSTNFTVDNISPLIQYTPAGAWREGSKTDPLYSSYSNGGTFTLCTTNGASATFTFNGTRVYVFGARRDNHGPYSVNIDGTVAALDGFSDSAIFGPLFVSDVLTQGQHTVTVTNEFNDTTKPYLDIDFITWTTTIGSSNGETNTIEDISDKFSYQPSSLWGTDLSSTLSGFSNDNGQYVLSISCYSCCLDGDVVTVFGPVGPTISQYIVQLDGKTSETFNATKANYVPQVSLFHADGLGSGQHTISLTSQPAVAGQEFAIDFAQVAGDSSGSLSQSSVAPVALAIGCTIGGIAVLTVIIVLVLFLWRRRRRWEREARPAAFQDKYPTATNDTKTTLPGLNPTASSSQSHLLPASYPYTTPHSLPITNAARVCAISVFLSSLINHNRPPWRPAPCACTLLGGSKMPDPCRPIMSKRRGRIVPWRCWVDLRWVPFVLIV